MTRKNRYTCLQLTDTTARRVDLRLIDGVVSPVAKREAPIEAPGTSARVDTIKNLLSDRFAQQIFVSLSSNSVLLKKVRLPTAIPPADPETQHAAIRTMLDTENTIPVALTQVAYDFHLMTPSTLLYGWMRRGDLEPLTTHLSAAGIPLAKVTPQPVVLANQLLTEWGDSSVCGVHIDGESCDIVVIEAGEVVSARSVLIKTPDDLQQTIQHTLKTDSPVKQIVLYYTDSVPPELPVIGDAYEVTTAPFNWAKSLCTPFVRSEGIALNLLAPIIARQQALTKRKWKHRRMWFYPLTALVLLVCANGILFYDTQTIKAQKTADTHRQAQIQALIAETDALKTQHSIVMDALAQLTWGEHAPPPLAQRFIAIAKQIPATVRLTEIKTVPPPRDTKSYVEFDARYTILLVGIAENQTDIDAFRVGLLTSPLFSTVTQVATEQIPIGGDKRLSFTLQLTSKHGGGAP